MSILYLLFSLISLILALVRADYTIDDSNYSILKFSENPAGPVWGPFGSDTGEVLEIRLPNGTTQTVDATQCYDGTYTYAACSASNNCAVQFSFTGSGITIYVLQAGPQGMSASLSIDSGTPTTATLAAPPPPQYYIPHVVLFNVQNIPSGTHSAVMKVQDWNGGFSGMMLDYVNVNQAQVSGPTSATKSSAPAQSPPSTSTDLSQSTSSTGAQTSSATTHVTSVGVLSVLSFQSSGTTALPSSTPAGNNASTTVSSSSTSKPTNLAAIRGGVAGGVAGLLVLLGLAFFCFRRRSRQRMLTLNERPSPLLFPQPDARCTDVHGVGADPFASSGALSASQPSGTYMRPLQSWTDSEAGSTPNSTNNPSPTRNLTHTRVASSGSATSSAPVSLGIAAAAAIPQDRNASALVPPTHLAVRPRDYPSEKSGGSSQQDQTADVRPNTMLTDDQADFVNSLFNNNVPAPVVARVLERMLASSQGANMISYSDSELRHHLFSQVQTSSGAPPLRSTISDFGDGETTIGTAPPSYDYVQAQ